MHRVWVMLPDVVSVDDMIVILESLVSQLYLIPRPAYVKHMRIGLVEREAKGHNQVKGIEIYVEGGDCTSDD